MDEQGQRRRRLIAALTVVLPILTGILIAAVAHLAGGGETSTESLGAEPRPLVEAKAPAATGSTAPRVRLIEAATGRGFDSASLGQAPFAVVFIDTRCEALGNLLGRAARELGGGRGAILVITSNPAIDRRRAVRAWLSRHHIEAGGPLRYLVGEEAQLRGYWQAWGFTGPRRSCPGGVAAHLVQRTGEGTFNSGVVDLGPGTPVSALTTPLRLLSR